MPKRLASSPPVTEADAAEYLGFKPSALKKWRREGRGPRYLNIGYSVRYLPTDLDAWLEAHVVQTRESA